MSWRRGAYRRQARQMGGGAARPHSENTKDQIPRWIVVTGLAIYCSLIWGIAAEFGASALKNWAPRHDEVAQAHAAVAQESEARR